jgi:hypothetical protein
VTTRKPCFPAPAPAHLSFLHRRNRRGRKIHNLFSCRPPSLAQGWSLARACLVHVSCMSCARGVSDSLERWRFWPHWGASEGPCPVAGLIHQHGGWAILAHPVPQGSSKKMRCARCPRRQPIFVAIPPVNWRSEGCWKPLAPSYKRRMLFRPTFSVILLCVISDISIMSTCGMREFFCLRAQ